MRNIKRVVLWGLPPSFCALVQRAGRAGRDFTTLGEAILIVPVSVVKKGIEDIEIEAAVNEAAVESQAENRNEGDAALQAEGGIVVAEGNEAIHLDDGGVRVSNDSDDEAEMPKKKKRKTLQNECNRFEAKFLSMFAGGKRCRRLVWDRFFGNNKKRTVSLPTLFATLTDPWARSTCLPHQHKLSAPPWHPLL
jgi:hypothetical protein